MVHRAASRDAARDMDATLFRESQVHFRIHVLVASDDYGRLILPQHEDVLPGFPKIIFLRRQIVIRVCRPGQIEFHGILKTAFSRSLLLLSAKIDRPPEIAVLFEKMESRPAEDIL